MKNRQIHPAFTLRHTLKGHTHNVYRMALSPDGRVLASPSEDKTVRLWDIEKGTLIRILEGHKGGVICTAWSPDGKMLASGGGSGNLTIRIWNSAGAILQALEGQTGTIQNLSWSLYGLTLASGSNDHTVRIWNIKTRRPLFTLKKHSSSVNNVAFSPDGNRLCSGSNDRTIRIWDTGLGKEIRVLEGTDFIKTVAWSPDGKRIVSGLYDKTIRIHDPKTGKETNILEAHTDHVVSVSFFAEGRLLGSLGKDGRLIIWRTDTWAEVVNIDKIGSVNSLSNIAVHSTLPVMAVCGNTEEEINIWDLNPDLLLGTIPVKPSVHYINAKVVLVGESGVGKSGLGIRMAEQEFRVTESTHGAQFWQIPVPEQTITPQKNLTIKAELTIWDLAGQPEYRLVHQLFLDDTDAALLLFDCSDPADPFRGVGYWAKVLKKHAPSHIIKLLVSARCDVSPVTVTKQEIHKICAHYGLEEYCSTSAKNNDGVQSLFSYILTHIPWDQLPRTTTPELFEVIRELLLELKETKESLVSLEDIKKEIKKRYTERRASDAEITTVISLLQARGFVFRLDPRPGMTMILMKPELINQYASSVIQAARKHPLGIGSVTERDVLVAGIPFSGFARLGPDRERIVLEATVELLVRHDLCFREMGYLVFPSQINVTRPHPPADHPRTEVAYKFSGSIETIYASLVVRLGHTGHFRREGQWKYAVEFSRDKIRLGFSMHQVEEGTGELEVYFFPGISEADRITFIRFITEHLKAKGIDIKEQIRLYCHKCEKEIQNLEAIENRVREGHLDIPCQYCGAMVMIPGSIEERYEKDPKLIKKQKELVKIATEQTEKEIEEFKMDRQQYTNEDDSRIHILHLSDIHLENESQARRYRVKLELDLKNELKIKRIEYLVISGDIANYSKEEEYKAAFAFVDGLVKRFGLDAGRVIIVPGNHDLNWDLSEDAYPFVPKRKLPHTIDTERSIPAGDAGMLVRDDERYKERFAYFSSQFYKRVYTGREFPPDYEEQVVFVTQPKDRILFLGLNSSWQLDHHFRKRAGINPDALAGALDTIQGRAYENWLKIAVWHHPVAGKETMDTAFMEQLTVSGFKICMHGHIHEATGGFHTYDDKRGIRIIGAGTFGAPTKEQVPGIPLQYNLLTYDAENRSVIVNTRKKEKPEGSWSADARWGDKNNPDAFYTFTV